MKKHTPGFYYASSIPYGYQILGVKSIGIILTIFVFSNWGISSTSAQTVISQGRVTVENNIYGNDVLKRAVYLTTGGRKAFLDFDRSLPTGQLKRFFIYIHNCSNTQVGDRQYCDTTGKENILIKLQIWRPVDIAAYNYSLVWTTDILVNFTSSTGFLVTYSLPNSQTVFTNDGDRIGWTNVEDFGPISFNYTEGHKTYFLNLQANQLPVVGTEYAFDNIYLPTTFSVAVDINPRATTLSVPEEETTGNIEEETTRNINTDARPTLGDGSTNNTIARNNSPIIVIIIGVIAGCLAFLLG